MSDTTVGNTSNVGGTTGTSGSSTTKAPTPEQIQANINAGKTKIAKDLNNLNSNTSSTKGMQDQATKNQQYSQDLTNIKNQITALQKAGAPETEIAGLQAQLLGVSTTLNQLLYGTESVIFSALQTLGFSTKTSTTTGLPPILSVPLSNGNSQKLSAQSVAALKNQVAEWLGPNLITAIFKIMEEIVKRKIQNIDTYRQFQWNSIAGTEAAALSAAQSEVLEGQLQAASQRAQAAGQLASGIIGMSLGFLSIGFTFGKVGSIEKEYGTKPIGGEVDDVANPGTKRPLLGKQGELDYLRDKNKITEEQHSERSQQMTMQKQNAIQNSLQSDPWLRTLTVGEQTFAQIAQGIGTMIGAGYTAEAAYAKAASMLWQQMIQCNQNITQDMSQAIQGAVQDIQGILQAFGSISGSLTNQSGR